MWLLYVSHRAYLSYPLLPPIYCVLSVIWRVGMGPRFWRPHSEGHNYELLTPLLSPIAHTIGLRRPSGTHHRADGGDVANSMVQLQQRGSAGSCDESSAVVAIGWKHHAINREKFKPGHRIVVNDDASCTCTQCLASSQAHMSARNLRNTASQLPDETSPEPAHLFQLHVLHILRILSCAQ